MTRRHTPLQMLACLGLSMGLTGCCLNDEDRLVWSLHCPNILDARGKSGASFGPPDNLSVALSHTDPGALAAHLMSCDIDQGVLQLLRARVVYPTGFGFDADGPPFMVYGPPGSIVGHYSIDVDFDGIPESTYPVRSMTDQRQAWVDMDEDGVHDPFEPVVTAMVVFSGDFGNSVLDVSLPLGGDDNAMVIGANRPFRASLELLPGLLRNPQQAGEYEVLGVFDSVDPDSGGADDGGGAPPQSFMLAVSLAIGTPLLVDGFEEPAP